MKENDLETQARKLALEHGWLVRKIMFIGHTGGPDRFFAKLGRVVLIELKRPGKTARRRQESEIKELRDAGVEVYVCDTLERVKKCLGIYT